MNYTDLDYRVAYIEGMKLFEERRFFDAKPYLIISKDSPIYQKQSLITLVLIEIYTTNYQKARNLLEKYKDILYPTYQVYYALLERIEFNLDKSLGIVLDSFDDFSNPSKKLILLADIYIELGEYAKAKLVLETILRSNNLTAILKFIYLDIIERDFIHALRLLKSIEKLIDIDTYSQIKALITYHIGTLQDTKDLNSNVYFVKRLLNEDEDILINHLMVRHIKNHNVNESIFLRNIDILDLIKKVKEMIKDSNPNFDKNALIYHLEFPDLIGYNNGIPTNSIKVVVALGTDKIITMYPSVLSDSYNKEGLREDKELSLKRGLKWKN